MLDQEVYGFGTLYFESDRVDKAQIWDLYPCVRQADALTTYLRLAHRIICTYKYSINIVAGVSDTGIDRKS